MCLESTVADIKKKTLLSHPNYNIEFTLQTDASERAVGSVLFQRNNMIEFHSSKLIPS